MPIVPLDIPPGFYKNGTPYAKRGRYENGSLARYHDGSYRPIGGWVRRNVSSTDEPIAALVADADDETVRDMIAWRDNSQVLNIVFFSNLKVYHLSALNVVTDVTPAGYTAINSSKDASSDRGYGLGPYGLGPYGVTIDLTGGEVTPPDRWYFDTFGEVLLFGAINNDDIYELDLSDLSTSVVTNAPTDNADICITEQRQVFVVGADGDPRRVRASEVEDRTLWTAATDNQAINRVLPGDGLLLRCIPVNNQILIIGEKDAHVAQYIGPPYVYSIDQIGVNCGPITPKAAIGAGSFVVWWGRRNFWLYDGSLQELPCEVIDFLYDDYNPGQVSKISTLTISEYSEVWWLYQSSSASEIDSYVAWNYKNNVWHTGRLKRTAGTDKGATTQEIMVDQDGQIFNHELAGVYPLNEGDVFVETGPLDIANGEVNMAVRAIYPDTEALSDVSYTLYARQFPTGTEQAKTYTAANPTKTRIQGRSIRMRVDLNSAAAEHGTVRFDVAPMGTGKR